MYSYKVFIVLLTAIITIQCSDDEASIPPEITISQLQASPDTIVVESRQLYLETYLYRDFQPICPPDGFPLSTIIYVTATDTAQLSGSIRSDLVWIVYNDTVWKSWLHESTLEPLLKPYRIVMVADEGPKWGPHVYVDVIVRVFDGKGYCQLLRAPNQWIRRTD